MGIKDLFNFLILALSLSTVLLTLLSFFIFKIRQVKTMRIRRSEIVLETAFFRRYAPKLVAQNKAQSSALPASSEVQVRLPFWKTPLQRLQARYPSFFGGNALIFTSCSLALFVALVVNEIASQGELDVDQASIARHAQGLQAKGLLERHHFDAFAQNPKLIERVPASEISNLEASAKVLEDLRFIIVQPDENAGTGWYEFLSELGVRHIETLTASQIPSHMRGTSRRTVIILTDTAKLNRSERKDLDRVFQSAVSVIATGSLGLSAFEDDQEAKEWTKRWFDLALSKRGSQAETEAVLAQAQWDFNPSIIGDLSPSFRIPSSLLGNHHFSRATQNQRSFGHIANEEGTRRLWLAFGPESLDEFQEKDRLQMRQILLRSLAWLGHQPFATTAPWKAGAPGAVAVVLSGEEGGSLDNLVDEASEARLPFSVFMTPGKRSRWSSLPKWMSEAKTSPHLRVPNAFQAWTDPQRNFNLLQDHRFTIERRSERPVAGVHLDRPVLTPQELNLIEQNKFSYMISPFPATGGRPVSVGDLVVLPTMAVDDIDVSSRLEVASVRDASRSLLQEVDAAVSRSGYATLVLHAQVSGEKPFREMLKDLSSGLRERQYWAAPADEVARWWKARKNVQIRYERKTNGAYSLVIRNDNPEAIDDLAVQVAADFDKPRLPSSAPESNSQTITFIVQNERSALLRIPRIGPGESISIELENQP